MAPMIVAIFRSQSMKQGQETREKN